MKIQDAKMMPPSTIKSSDPIFSMEIGSKESPSHFKDLSLSSHFALILANTDRNFVVFSSQKVLHFDLEVTY